MKTKYRKIFPQTIEGDVDTNLDDSVNQGCSGGSIVLFCSFIISNIST